MALDFVSNQEIIVAAREKLDPHAWIYLTGGAESETTMRRNRLGARFARAAPARPRRRLAARHVDHVSRPQAKIPVLLAPIGSLQILTPEGALAVAKAAAEFGTVNFVSSVPQPRSKRVAAATRAPKDLPALRQGDMKWVEDILARVKRAGFSASASPSTPRSTAGASAR
jgi:glycolate oxidase